MCWLRKYVAALLVMFLAPMVSLGLDKDSTFFSLLQKFEEVGPYTQCFNLLQVTEEQRKPLKTMAMDAGYTASESVPLMRAFLSEVYPTIRKEFFDDLFSDVSEEEMREALAYFDSEQARTVVQHLNHVSSKECVDKLLSRIISDMVDTYIDKKVPKKKCDAPSKYQKLCLPYLKSSGTSDFLFGQIGSLYAQLGINYEDGEGDSELHRKMSKCIVTEIIQSCYSTVTMEDLLFFDKFTKTAAGTNINACAEVLPYWIDDFFGGLEFEFESFLKTWQEKNPPAHWNVTPEDTPVEVDDKGNI